MSPKAFPEELLECLNYDEAPSEYFKALRESGELRDAYPEIYSLIGVKQNPVYHAEGDVFTHTMLVIDRAAIFRDEMKNRLGFMLAALLHDVGKAVCTKRINGVLHSYGHETKGLPIAEKFLKRYTSDKMFIGYVLALISLHMKPNNVAADNSAVKVTNRMFDDSPEPLALLRLAKADSLGKRSERPYVSYDDFLFERLRIYNECMSAPYVTKEELISLGIPDNKNMVTLIKEIHKLRLSMVDRDSALKHIIALSRSLEKNA